MKDTPTPRTDEAWAAWQYAGSGMSVHVGRELERELTAVTEQRDRLAEERDGWREAANSLAEAIPASWEELQPPAEQLRKYKEMIALQHEKYKSIL